MPHWIDPPDIRDFGDSSRQDTYEAACVKYILQKRGWQKFEAEIIGVSQQEAGVDYPTLTAMAKCVPFPLQLGCRKMKHITGETLLQLHSKPNNTPMYEAYKDLRQEWPSFHSIGRLGLVFQWPRWAKFVLLHGDVRVINSVGVRTVHYGARSSQPLILETLDSYLATVTT